MKARDQGGPRDPGLFLLPCEPRHGISAQTRPAAWCQASAGDFRRLQKGSDGRKASPARKGAAAGRAGVSPGASAKERKTWVACTGVLGGWRVHTALDVRGLRQAGCRQGVLKEIALLPALHSLGGWKTLTPSLCLVGRLVGGEGTNLNAR